MKYNPEYENTIISTIHQLKACINQLQIQHQEYMRIVRLPEHCNQLGCDPKYSNLRCTRLKGT